MSRPITRVHPQFRPDCSPPIRPFSHCTTGLPFSARNSAVEVPTMPPPITTTLVRVGITVSACTVSIRGAMSLSLQAHAHSEYLLARFVQRTTPLAHRSMTDRLAGCEGERLHGLAYRR